MAEEAKTFSGEGEGSEGGRKSPTSAAELNLFTTSDESDRSFPLDDLELSRQADLFQVVGDLARTHISRRI